MQKFKDRNGRDWGIEITHDSVVEVRAALGLNLYELIEENFGRLGKLTADVMALVDVVFVLVGEQAKTSGVTATMFAKALAAESIEEMSNAFMRAYIDFFPNRETATLLQKTVETTRKVVATMAEENRKALENLDVSKLVESLKGKSGLLRASSESTQESTASVNSQ